MRRNVLSILIPLYNEQDYIGTLLDRVLAAPLPDGIEREICLVDDCSRDDSLAIATAYAARYPNVIRLGRHEVNRGKGAAVRSALALATGEYCVFQDADLEYDPREIQRLLIPMIEGRADVVFGSRFAYTTERRVLYFWHTIANKGLTLLCNMACDLNLTDMETCYKAFRTTLLKSIPIRRDRFGIEPELTIKVAKRRARVYEVPISYHGRTYAEGKKIGLKDAFDALWVIVSTAFGNDIYVEAADGNLDVIGHAPRFHRWMADTINPYLGRSVLEIGAGAGQITPLLLSGNRRWTAADHREERLERLASRFYGRRNMEVRYCDVTRAATFDDLRGGFDSVLCLNVLEHVEDDDAGLRNLASATAPGGNVVLLVPNDPTVFGPLDQALGRHRRYSQTQLEQKLAAAGLQLEKVIEFNRVSRPLWLLGSRVLKTRRLVAPQVKLYDRFIGLARPLDAHLPWPANSLIAVARKPA